MLLLVDDDKYTELKFNFILYR